MDDPVPFVQRFLHRVAPPLEPLVGHANEHTVAAIGENTADREQRCAHFFGNRSNHRDEILGSEPGMDLFHPTDFHGDG